jgi:hypothetical protein
LQFFRLKPYKTAFFKGCCSKTEVLEQPRLKWRLRGMKKSIIFPLFLPLGVCLSCANAYASSGNETLQRAAAGVYGDGNKPKWVPVMNDERIRENCSNAP